MYRWNELLPYETRFLILYNEKLALVYGKIGYMRLNNYGKVE